MSLTRTGKGLHDHDHDHDHEGGGCGRGRVAVFVLFYCPVVLVSAVGLNALSSLCFWDMT